MKTSRSVLPFVLGGLHLAFCVAFFALYFSSHDPQRSMLFIVFIPVDPWIVPLSKFADFPEAVFALVVSALGTLQWFSIGLLVRAAVRFLKSRTSRSSERA